MTMTRREFLVQASVAGAVGAFAGAAAGEKKLPDSWREAGKRRGILAGCAVAVDKLRNDPAYAEVIRSQASIVVAENEFKFGRLRPSATEYFFDDADYLAEFAKTNNMKLRGHNFVWHRSLPKWFSESVTTENAEHVLVEHIEHVAGRYAGRIHSWDVVNEAIAPKDKLPEAMRNSPWQKVLPGYIDIAYRAARRVDPKALLVYNDYGIEREGEEADIKRNAVLALLRGMQDRKVPIDGLGIQSHVSAGSSHVYGPGLQRLIAEARSMGLKVFLTEIDVDDRELPADFEARDAGVAKVYEDYLHAALADPAVKALLLWGITDHYTWLNTEDPRADKLPQRPLAFDRECKAKPAQEAILRALVGAPSRKG